MVGTQEKSLADRRTDFFKETVEFYKADVTRRAKGTISCVYRTLDGRKCAIGRWIPDDKYTPEIEYNGNVNNNIMELLPLHIQSLGKFFLSEVQIFHDSDRNWNEDGLSYHGTQTYTSIINKIERNHYDQ